MCDRESCIEMCCSVCDFVKLIANFNDARVAGTVHHKLITYYEFVNVNWLEDYNIRVQSYTKVHK